MNKEEVTWKKLDKAIGRKGVHDITKKFRSLGIINQDNYNLNKKNLREIKELVSRYIENKKQIINTFEAFVSFISKSRFIILLFAILTGTLISYFNYGLNKTLQWLIPALAIVTFGILNPFYRKKK